jgi:hypothetical protein
MRYLAAAITLLCLTVSVFADDAEKAVQTKLDDLKAPKPAKLEAIKDEAVTKTCPHHTFYGVFYAQYPIARELPEGLQYSMIFVVTDGKATLIKDVKELEKTFIKAAAKCDTEAKKKDAARAWLALSQNLHQDLFYKFKLMDDSTKVDGTTATAKLMVAEGGRGELNATVTFDDKGQITKAGEESKIVPGPRPRCHATKLLDADPIIRRIVEDDLLYMGKAALPYLQEQHDKAAPELKKAIAAIMERISTQDR